MKVDPAGEDGCAGVEEGASPIAGPAPAGAKVATTPAPERRAAVAGPGLACTVYLPMAAVACAWIMGRYGQEELTQRIIGLEPLPALLVGVATGTILVAASRVLGIRWREAQRLESALAEIVGPLSPRDCLLLALLSGIAEELFFRGALQREIGLLWTTLIFGALHAPIQRDLLLWTPFALAAGFLFGVLFDVLGSLVAPAAAHVLVNTINLRALARYHEARAASTGP